MADLEVHVTARRGGKTSRALAWMAVQPADRRAMVCHSATEAERTYVEAVRLYPWAGFKRSQFVSMESARQGSLRGRDVATYVDNAEVILAHLLGTRVAGVALTGRPA